MPNRDSRERGTTGPGTHQLADLLGLQALGDDVQGPLRIGRRQLDGVPAGHGARPRAPYCAPSPARASRFIWKRKLARAECVEGTRRQGHNEPRLTGD